MKKTYETPTVEVVEFKYRDQVVAASGAPGQYGHTGYGKCENMGQVSDGNSSGCING